jgi:hypothetical protein
MIAIRSHARVDRSHAMLPIPRLRIVGGRAPFESDVESLKSIDHSYEVRFRVTPE